MSGSSGPRHGEDGGLEFPCNVPLSFPCDSPLLM